LASPLLLGGEIITLAMYGVDITEGALLAGALFIDM